jgi:hypothetical protein
MNEAIDILTFLGIPGDKIQRYQALPVFERMRKRVLYINRNRNK